MNDIMNELADGLESTENAELFYSEHRELQIKAFRGEIASVLESEDKWVSARMVPDHRLGSAFTEKIDSRAIKSVISHAVTNAAFADEDPGNTLFDKPETGDYDGRKGDLSTLEMDGKRSITLAAEERARGHDSRIINVPHCYYFENAGSFAIANSFGLRKTQQVASCGSMIMVMAREGEDTQTGFEFIVGPDPAALDMEAAAITATNRAIEKLGAKEIDSGEYPVVFDYITASQLLGAFIASPVSPFFGENIQKGRSMLMGKLGQRIGSQLFTVADDPEKGLAPAYFDGDGVATSVLTLVDRGVFTGIVHNIYSAAREEGAQTTGHASRSRGGVGTGLHHPYLENGAGTVDELVDEMSSGFLVTEITGLHAGLNPVTGDFSLSAQGFWIEGGSRVFPVRNAVVAGNFFELASRIVRKAGDMHDDTRGGFDSPSLLVEKLSVSGK